MLLWLLAQNIEDYQKQLEEINRLIIENQEKLEELKKQEKSILKELSILNARIQLYNEKIQLLKLQVQKLQNELDLLNRKKEELTKEIEEKRKKLNTSAKLLYKIPKENMWSLLLKTGSFYTSYRIEVSLLSVLRYYKNLVNDLREKQKQLEITQNKIDITINTLNLKLKDEEIALNELNRIKQEKNNRLSRIRTNKIERQVYLSELERAKQKLESIINELSKKKESVKKTTGISLLMPVNGKIVNDFGIVYDKIYGTKTKNSGIDIQAPKDSPVRAAESGSVVYVGFIEGYGNIIIIEHSGFYTIYSQITKISIKKGDNVIKGQEIAKVSDEPMHFELRIGKEAVDPKPYFTSQF
ncbi:MAG: peptidoglycan DD-metalloendopeptidase family protein [candidate division WOR-3 bacterium]|nr:peptidoglycan DD-metalloendopeptidase family protein [candidate division WOR-3 bacterium]